MEAAHGSLLDLQVRIGARPEPEARLRDGRSLTHEWTLQTNQHGTIGPRNRHRSRSIRSRGGRTFDLREHVVRDAQGPPLNGQRQALSCGAGVAPTLRYRSHARLGLVSLVKLFDRVAHTTTNGHA